ncbi:MAG: PP2C family protein-serine/threonine phosphatase [Ruminococcus sp.]|nr:PP2C family protein-serine/threonine phosphatase [Ruminococcus sp.]
MSDKKFSSFFKIYESKDTKAIFEQNEYESNRLSLIVIIACAVILAVSWLLNFFGVFQISKLRMNLLAGQGVIELIIPIVLYFVFKGRKRWLKYAMVIALLLVCARLFSILNHNVVLIMILPVLLSSRYFSKGFTLQISILSVAFLAIASISTIFYGLIDLNFYPSPPSGTSIVVLGTLRQSVAALGIDPWAAAGKMMLHGFLPRLLVFLIIIMISILIADRGHVMVLKQDAVSRASANVKAELDTATKIQNSMVPNIFPAFPDRKEFDIYAAMYTAKEVGGDFYDFFLIDEDHLAMVIADVSGKGVPAALFMMASKILINDRTLMGGTPGEILEFVNTRICRNNTAEMFVTVWLGILDIRTGKVQAANAGHEYPAIRRSGGEFEVLVDKHSFVVGGMEGMKYKDYEFTLKKGDALFLYTDGITEAHNPADELFGEDRMTEALNLDTEIAPDETIANVKAAIDEFVGDAERFDDLTMLCLKYFGNDKD